MSLHELFKKAVGFVTRLEESVDPHTKSFGPLISDSSVVPNGEDAAATAKRQERLGELCEALYILHDGGRLSSLNPSTYLTVLRAISGYEFLAHESVRDELPLHVKLLANVALAVDDRGVRDLTQALLQRMADRYPELDPFYRTFVDARRDSRERPDRRVVIKDGGMYRGMAARYRTLSVS
ncbi:MAG: hypothetical protein SFW62_05520 [Alphaproteobacteria bacterium]|nr:hypothetical protein [Alphaproteobacteria bacterium]